MSTLPELVTYNRLLSLKEIHEHAQITSHAARVLAQDWQRRGWLEKDSAAGNKRSFIPDEKRTLLNILRERGGTERAAVGNEGTWKRDLDAHWRIIKRRRDLAFRLARLTALGLCAEDQELVESLRASNVNWRDGRMRVLTEKQERLITVMETRYDQQRTKVSQDLAQTLIHQFGL